jgi:hypothetical protein
MLASRVECVAELLGSGDDGRWHLPDRNRCWQVLGLEVESPHRRPRDVP